MADKAFIDSVQRLQHLYMIANKESYPIKNGYFAQVS